MASDETVSVARQILMSSRLRKSTRARVREILNLLAERRRMSVMEYAAQKLIDPSYVRRLFQLVALRHADVEFHRGVLRLIRRGEEEAENS